MKIPTGRWFGALTQARKRNLVASLIVICGLILANAFALAPLVTFASSIFYTDSSGNIGIGNSDPLAALDVSGAIYSRLAALTDTTSTTVNWSTANVESIILSTNTTFTFSNAEAGGEYKLILNQDSTGGRSVTWPNSILWPGASTPTLTTAASSTDICSFVYNGSNYLGSCQYNYAIPSRTLATYTTDDGSYSQFGQTGTYQKLAQPFTVSSSGKLQSISVYVKAQNSPSDHVTVSVYSDSSGAPGSLLETGSNIDPTGSFSTITSTFSGTTQLNTSTTYWLVLARTGTLDSTNDYVWSFGATSPPYSAVESYNGSTWSNGFGNTYNGNFTVMGD